MHKSSFFDNLPVWAWILIVLGGLFLAVFIIPALLRFAIGIVFLAFVLALFVFGGVWMGLALLVIGIIALVSWLWNKL